MYTNFFYQAIIFQKLAQFFKKNNANNEDITITFNVGFGDNYNEKLNEETRGNKKEYFYENKKTRKQS